MPVPALQVHHGAAEVHGAPRGQHTQGVADQVGRGRHLLLLRLLLQLQESGEILIIHRPGFEIRPGNADE